MPKFILDLIFNTQGRNWSADELLQWVNYVPYTSEREKNYIIKIAKIYE